MKAIYDKFEEMVVTCIFCVGCILLPFLLAAGVYCCGKWVWSSTDFLLSLPY